MVNSHDGTSAYNLIAGMFRLICSNGAMVSDGTIESVHVKHQGNVINDVIEGSYRIIENAPKALEQVNAWKNLQLTDGEQKAFASQRTRTMNRTWIQRYVIRMTRPTPA